MAAARVSHFCTLHHTEHFLYTPGISMSFVFRELFWDFPLAVGSLARARDEVVRAMKVCGLLLVFVLVISCSAHIVNISTVSSELVHQVAIVNATPVNVVEPACTVCSIVVVCTFHLG